MTTPNVATTTAPPTRPADAPAPASTLDQFPDFPPRTDMMNTTHLHDYGNQPTLRLHLGNPETTVVLGEVPLYWQVTRRRAEVRIPDLLIAFDIRRARVIAQKGYSIRDQGKPPEFVLEVASDTTARNDQLDKWVDYAAFGVLEYWLFDPDWGLRYPSGLIGWRLVNGRFVRIIVHEYAPGMYFAWSAVLGLYVCWEFGRLRWYDPLKGYLRTHDEERSSRIAAVAQRNEERSSRIAAEAQRNEERDSRIAAEAQRNEERSSRIAAEAQRNEERDSRIAAEAQRDEERNSRIAAEAELQRLRAEMARRQAGADDGNDDAA